MRMNEEHHNHYHYLGSIERNSMQLLTIIGEKEEKHNSTVTDIFDSQESVETRVKGAVEETK